MPERDIFKGACRYKIFDQSGGHRLPLVRLQLKLPGLVNVIKHEINYTQIM